MTHRIRTGVTTAPGSGHPVWSRNGSAMRVLLYALLALATLSPAAAWAQAATEVGVSCRRLTGLAVGVVHAPATWERLGKSPTFPTLSPVLGGACALDLGPASISMGSEAQFTYVHYDLYENLTRGWLTFTAAAMAGNDEFRGGVHAVGGMLYPVGAGVSGMWLPGNPHGARDGLEARITGYWIEQPNFQLMVLYVVNGRRIP